MVRACPNISLYPIRIDRSSKIICLLSIFLFLLTKNRCKLSK